MKKLYWIGLGLFLFALLVVLTPARLASSASTIPDPPRVASPQSALQTAPEFVPGEILVGYKQDAARAPGQRSQTTEVELGISSLDQLNRELGVRAIEPVFHAENRKKLTARLARIFRLRLSPDADVLDAAARFARDPNVAFAEPNFIAHTLIKPIDSDYSKQWGLEKIAAPAAWDRITGTPYITIAVIDSGVDLNHPELRPKLWINPGEKAGNGIDDDHNFKIDDVNGWNFVSGNNNPLDDNGHGTLVAGIAAALTNTLPPQGIAGMCWSCPLMPVKVANAAGAANYSDIALGITYAADKGARVINISLGGSADSQTLHSAIQDAVNKYGAVVVAGAGNDNSDALFYPAAYDEVLAVAGTDKQDARVATSNYGTWVDVSAPGQEIYTTASGGYAESSGTSLASPFAAGLAALLRSLYPNWSESLVRAQIKNTADNLDGINPGYVGKLGSGRINAGRALNTPPQPQLVLANYSVNAVVQGRPNPGSNAQLKVSVKNTWLDAYGVFGTLSENDPLVDLGAAGQPFNTIPNGKTVENSNPFILTIKPQAGYNHVIPLKLHLVDGSGRAFDLNFNVTTRSNVVMVSGIISSNTLWTADHIYEVIENFLVDQGVTLTIQPGTVVRFVDKARLQVAGTLIADGQADKRILFTSAETKEYGAWGPIGFGATAVSATIDPNDDYVSGSIVRYARIEYGKGLKLEAAPFISDDEFFKNKGNFFDCCSYAVVGYNDFSNQRTNETFAVRRSTFTDNHDYGVVASILNGRFEVTDSVFTDQLGAAVLRGSGGVVDILIARNRLTRTKGIGILNADQTILYA